MAWSAEARSILKASCASSICWMALYEKVKGANLNLWRTSLRCFEALSLTWDITQYRHRSIRGKTLTLEESRGKRAIGLPSKLDFDASISA